MQSRERSKLPPLTDLDPEALLAHRELAVIRNPSPRRFRKLDQAKRIAGER